jgi:hypothetical protein
MNILKATFFTDMGARRTIANEVAEHGARFPLDAATKLPHSIPLIEL